MTNTRTQELNKQYAHEIKWLEAEIEKLAKKLAKKPRVQRQIDDYRRQIKDRQNQINFSL